MNGKKIYVSNLNILKNYTIQVVKVVVFQHQAWGGEALDPPATDGGFNDEKCSETVRSIVHSSDLSAGQRPHLCPGDADSYGYQCAGTDFSPCFATV